MSCEQWTEKLDAYLDGELAEGEARTVSDHLRTCAACAAESLSRVQMKRAIESAAAQRYIPDPAFRARIRTMASRRSRAWNPLWFAVLAAPAAFVAVLIFVLILGRGPGNDRQLLSELTDLHVATLASSNPVDVVSTDRHTVKPWFAGKIPFTFNLPELRDSPFTLVGGKVSYLRQSPGAELLFRIRQHQISVFIFQDRAVGSAGAIAQNTGSFNLRSWSENGLCYFAISDVAGPDLDRLVELIKAAG